MSDLVSIFTSYVNDPGCSLTQMDACRMLRKTPLRYPWSKVKGLYSENAASVVQLMDTGRTEIDGVSYWLLIDTKALAKRIYPLPIMKIEIELKSSSKTMLTEGDTILEGLLLSNVESKFFEYLNKRYPERGDI